MRPVAGQRKKPTGDPPKSTRRRSYLSQSDVPRHSLNEALRIPFALAEEYGKQPARPVDVAVALEILPTTGHFKNANRRVARLRAHGRRGTG